MNVYWLEQTLADVPPDNEWLSSFELSRLSQMFVRKRSDDWRLGRWTAKRALAARAGLPAQTPVLAEIEIVAAQSGVPEVFINSRPADATISLSHRAGVGLCVVAPVGVALGCDLEVIEPHSDAFIADYFTDEERAMIAETPAIDRFRLLALLWSAKESALKAMHEGLRLDTRSVRVEKIDSFDLPGWNHLRVRHCGKRLFEGWWQRTDRMVRTVVSDPPVEAPIAITIEAPLPDDALHYA